jgi:hypothetical protein
VTLVTQHLVGGRYAGTIFRGFAAQECRNFFNQANYATWSESALILWRKRTRYVVAWLAALDPAFQGLRSGPLGVRGYRARGPSSGRTRRGPGGRA